MAYLQARSGIARAGVTHAGWSPSAVSFRVGGTARTIQHNATSRFSIHEQLDGQPSKLQFDAYGYTPTLGQSVTFAWTTPDAYLFAGTVTRRSMRLDKDRLAVWRCEALDDGGWLMNRYAKVTATYRRLGVNTILARILADFTDGGFRVGYCPASLGDLTAIEFSQENVSQAIDKLAAAVGTYWRVDPERRVYLADTWPDGNALSLSNSADIREVFYDDDLTQLRNRTTVIGGGSTTSAQTAGGATTLAVQDTTPFLAAGGTVFVERQVVTYTGYSVSSGPGTLTGCSGIAEDIPAEARVLVYRQANDATAQADLAATLGGGLSGIVAHLIPDDGLTDSEANLVAASDVAAFKAAPAGIEYDVVDRVSSIGKVVAVTITAPIAISGDYRIQSVTLLPRTVSGANMDFTRRVNARVFQQRLAALFRKVV